MRDTFRLSKLLLIESDVVVATDLNHRIQKLGLLMLPSLFLFHNDGPLNVKIIEFVLKDLKERRVLPAINADSLELVSKVLLDW